VAKVEDKFNVVANIDLVITKIGDTSENPWFELHGPELKYFNMDYLQITGVIQAIESLAQTLVDFGFAGAEAIGFDPGEVEKAKKVGKKEK